MSKKKNKRQATAAEMYALCVTVGLIIGLGLTPLMGNLLIMLAGGAVVGALAAFLLTRNTPRSSHRHAHRRHHHR
ncbi:MAG: hypothetical protein R3F50_15160 [Gammaproteobacteria bacterium]|jgi:hypothetical protein